MLHTCSLEDVFGGEHFVAGCTPVMCAKELVGGCAPTLLVAFGFAVPTCVARTTPRTSNFGSRTPRHAPRTLARAHHTTHLELWLAHTAPRTSNFGSRTPHHAPRTLARAHHTTHLELWLAHAAPRTSTFNFGLHRSRSAGVGVARRTSCFSCGRSVFACGGKAARRTQYSAKGSGNRISRKQGAPSS